MSLKTSSSTDAAKNPNTGTLRIGVVGLTDGWSSRQLADAVARQTGWRLLVDISLLSADLARGRVQYDGIELAELDALIVKKLGKVYTPAMLDRLELLRYLEQHGVRIFSRTDAIQRLLNRLACTVTLRSHEIPMPETVITEDIEEALSAVARFGRAVFKPLFTSKARGMLIIEHDREPRAAVEGFRAAGNQVFYIQRMVNLPGRDMGIAFLGGRYLAAYARVARGHNWNTTTHSGGRYERCEPAPEIIALAERAQALFGLDFTCVDVAETDDGPVVFEVSAFGGFRGLQEACGVDAAGRYAEYVVRKLTDER